MNREEARPVVANSLPVTDAPLPPALDEELDEVLGLLPLIDALPALADRLFDRLTEVLALAVLHDVRARHHAGAVGQAAYVTEMCQLVAQLRDRDLLRAEGP